MPVRSRIKLLAGVAALLGLCAAGAGCQSSAVCQDYRAATTCAACSPGAAGVVAGATGNQTAGTSRARPLFVRRATTDEPPALTQAASCALCQSAVMMRPIATSSAAGVEASAWAPIQRTSGEVSGNPNDSGISRAVTIDRPQNTTLVPVANLSNEAPLTPTPIAASDPPRLSDTRLVAAPPPANAPITLGATRVVKDGSAENNKTPSVGFGYPELPPVMVTHALDAPKEFEKRALSAYIIEPPDVLVVDGISDISDPKLPIAGPHLVRPDGTIGLGTYGAVFVAGLTIEQAKEQIGLLIQQRQDKLTMKQIREGLRVDVAAYNSKFYYVITDGGGYGEQVVRVPCTGNETVLDAVSQIQGLPTVASKKKIWIARATPGDHHHPYILPVDWCGIAQRGSAATNYQIYPGDRIYVNSDPFIRADSYLAKFLAPFERVLGFTLLGSSVVNSIKSGGSSNGSGSSVTR